jgi:hypothetical protein
MEVTMYAIFAEGCPPQVKWRIMDRFASTLSDDDHAAWRIFEHVVATESPEVEALVEYVHLHRALTVYLDKKQ